MIVKRVTCQRLADGAPNGQVDSPKLASGLLQNKPKITAQGWSHYNIAAGATTMNKMD